MSADALPPIEHLPPVQIVQEVDYDPERGMFREPTSNAPRRSSTLDVIVIYPGFSRTAATKLDLLPQEPLPIASSSVDIPAQLASIKRMTGLGWEDIASIVGCSRQTVHNWTLGGKASASHRDRVSSLYSAVVYIDRGDVDENRRLLTSAFDGQTAISMLQNAEYDRVKQAVGRGTPRNDATWGVVESNETSKHWYDTLVESPDALEGDFAPLPTKARKRLVLKKA